MIETVVTALVGLLGGVVVGLQSPLAGAMSQRIGGASCSLVVHVGGAILSGLLVVARGGEQLHHWRGLPWYMLGSGVFGVVLYLTLSHTVPRLGATSAIALVVVGQLIAGMVVDQLGLFGIPVRPADASRLAAVVLLVAGGYLAVR
jgi:bacterial/archaeal transporter family-2 protein